MPAPQQGLPPGLGGMPLPPAHAMGPRPGMGAPQVTDCLLSVEACKWSVTCAGSTGAGLRQLCACASLPLVLVQPVAQVE